MIYSHHVSVRPWIVYLPCFPAGVLCAADTAVPLSWGRHGGGSFVGADTMLVPKHSETSPTRASLNRLLSDTWNLCVVDAPRHLANCRVKVIVRFFTKDLVGVGRGISRKSCCCQHAFIAGVYDTPLAAETVGALFLKHAARLERLTENWIISMHFVWKWFLAGYECRWAWVEQRK